MSANIHPSDKCKDFFNRVKMSKCLYALARVEITDDNESIEVFYTNTRKGLTENDIGEWADDDEKSVNGVKKKNGKKPKGAKGDFEEQVWKPFCEVVIKELAQCGGWAMINVEYKDDNGNWNDKSVQILYSDDDELGIKKKFLLGACNNNVAGVSGGFKNIQVNSAGDLEDLEEIISKMQR